MNEPEEDFTPRRGTRVRAASKRAQESYVQIRKQLESDESDSEDDLEQTEKATIVHDNAVSGDKIFTFQTKKKFEAIINEPSRMQAQAATKTPHTVRNRIKKDIECQVKDFSDYSDSGSEYVDSEDTESSTDKSSDEEESPVVAKSKKIVSSHIPRGNRNYTMKTDDYFANHSSKKIITSNHTLDKLDTPRLPQDQLRLILSKLKLKDAHSEAVESLEHCAKSNFNKWMYLLFENRNILLYGLGSKKSILHSFQQKCLKKLPTVVINGFFPSLTVKDILDSIILTALELKENPINVYESCDLIEKEFSYMPDTHLYLIVNNIDMIRSGKAQNVLSRLAAVRNIHLIASIDHINAPLIWDHTKLSKFNFTWWDCTTFQPYVEETSFENSMMIQQSGNLALSSLRNVFRSLTSNAKRIYLSLVNYQIDNSKKQYYPGMAFNDLYSKCRDLFLVSSDIALRAQLSEFVDHHLMKFKRSADGTEFLVIPMGNGLLQQFVNEHEE